MNMKEHVKIVAYIYIVLGILIAISGIFLIFGLNVLGFAFTHLGKGMPNSSGILFNILGFFLAALFFVLGLPGIIAGFGLLKYRNWARILTIILSVIRLINFPIGTIIGGYSLWVLSHYETIQLFNEENHETNQPRTLH